MRAHVAVGLALVALGACSSGDDNTITTTDTAQPAAAEPGTAVVTVGGEELRFIVYECLVGNNTGSPNRRLALSASATEPFLEADEVLNVDILVSQATGTEDHVITITRMNGTDLGASDSSMPSRGGPAPDDWIEVDDDAGVVRGEGFELRATDGSGQSLGDGEGTLVADCPSG